MEDFKGLIASISESCTRRAELSILQMNMGNKCNQHCNHCHVNADLDGEKNMSRTVVDDVIGFLSKKTNLVLDITGGAPELNPNFRYLIKRAKGIASKIMVRNNLTIFFEEGQADMPTFYKDNKVRLVCSLPCYTKENVDRQRGEGVFDKSIEALQILNQLGYGCDEDLELDLAYNPGGAFLPGDQKGLERDYKKILLDKYGIVFNNLFTMTNSPINRFEQYLLSMGNFDDYMKLLIDNFNADVAGNIMCRSLLSVGWDGKLYDCDFNQMRNMPIKDSEGNLLRISDVDPNDFDGRDIIFENHCFCCTAGAGSSCTGSLNAEKRK